MAVPTFEAVTAELAGHEDALRLHRAAERVIASRSSGGFPSFRIHDIDEAIADRLPDYVASFEGSRLPQSYYGEDGTLTFSRGRIVDERDSRFSLSSLVDDEVSGGQSGWFKWDRELWDPEAYEQAQQARLATAQQAAATQERVARRNRLIRRFQVGVGALALSANLLGMGLIAKAASDSAPSNLANQDKAAMHKSTQEADLGLGLISGGAGGGAILAASLLFTPYARKTRQETPEE